MFDDLVSGDGIQANQFLITDDDHMALIDPGGDLTYTPLTIELSRILDISKLDYVFASHQDPDIITSLPRWLIHSQCRVVTSTLWARFLPHLASSFQTSRMQSDVGNRLVRVPDEGMRLAFGSSEIIVLPAHFLHSVGNLQFYDPVSRILFSGDMGAAVGGSGGVVTDFDRHVPFMEGFHRRYMASNKIYRLWANMVRTLDVAMIVPQHGGHFEGAMMERFLDWISHLDCGIDLLEQRDYCVPAR
jgi:flavorubredoxin